MPSFPELLRDVIRNKTLQRAVLSRPRKSSQAPYRKVTVRPISIQGEAQYQFSMQIENQETHENLPGEPAADRIENWCRTWFTDCHLYTNEDEYSVRFRKDGTASIKRTQPAAPREVGETHNRSKAHLIPEGVPCPFLIETGVMNRDGSVRPSKQKKFRQVNRFLELVNDIVPSLATGRKLSVVDFGCGKSYLTFALHFLLTEIHQLDVDIVGLDTKETVVSTCNELVEKLGLNGLEFRQQAIADFADTDKQVDLVVSLHACDTATDDTIAQAVQRQAQVILAVPCCQHEVNQAMTGDGVKSVARYGILKERLAAIATDALRAEILEQ